MDRSSLSKVETTLDLEKRQAFKDRLVSQIDSPQLEELPIVDNTFNGVSPGGKLFHPSLGEGTLARVDHKNNEVLIDFDSKGLIRLILTQARSFVHAPHKEEVKIVDDPFLGEEITRLLPDRSDTAHRDVDFSKVVSPDFHDTAKSFLPEGSAIVHPSLGKGTLIKVDQTKNEIVIDFVTGGLTTLVLSRSHSFLQAPVKPEVKAVTDPFVGSPILRDGPVRPNSVQRELDTSKIVSPDFKDTEKAFWPVGSAVIHPSLGDGRITKVDHANNEVVIDFVTSGPTPLVLSHAHSFLQIPARLEIDVTTDPFVGEEILRDGPVRPDAAQRKLDTSKVVSPDFTDSEKAFWPIGSVVVHPSLGQGKIVTVDQDNNEVVVDFVVSGPTPLVLSQSKSFLQAPVKSEVKAPADPFVGDKILRDGPVRHDTAQRTIDTSKVISPDFQDTVASFLPVGSKVVHPSLGDGTLVRVDQPKNEVIIDFVSGGSKTLVLSQSRSFLQTPVKSEVKAIEDPFVGDKILRDGPVRPDAVQRKLDTSKVISPDFKDTEKAFWPVGSTVVHPDLGIGSITKINQPKNEVTIDFATGSTTLSISQSRSFLKAPVKSEVKTSEDPFVGEKILRDGPVRPDAVQRELDTSKVISHDFKDTEKPFLPVGSKVVHPSLGEGTLVKVDPAKNEVTIDFVSGGSKTLVLNTSRSFLQAPIKSEVKAVEDPFIGDKILRDGPVRPDAVQRELDTSKVISPDFKDTEKAFWPVGSTVVHPDLGIGSITKIDQPKNEVTIDFATGSTTLSLSQSRSFLKAPVKSEVKAVEDPFIGDKILRDGPVKPDATQRKLDTSKIVSPDFKDTEKSYWPEGSTVVHPSLGQGTIINVDQAKNKVTVDFAASGVTTLVLSQSASFLKAPVKPEVKATEDPFIGDKIVRDGPIRPDAAQRKLDTSKVISPDFKDNEKPFLPVGSKVVHPDLGEGILINIDKTKNEVTIDFANGPATLVLSQSRSFLNVPVKPEVKAAEDPFIGEKILRDGPVKPDAIQRKLDTSKVVSPDFKDTVASFLPEGSTVVHPSLGEGTLVKIDKVKNEVTIDFTAGGLTTLVLSKSKAFLNVPVKPEVKAAEDPFIGEKIVRDGPVRPDAAQREIDTSKVVSPDFIDPKISSLSVGTKIFHKELGECTIVSVDKKANEIVLDSNRHGFINLVFSQAHPYLTPIDAIKKESKNSDDPFIGDTIIRDGPVRPDVAQRELSNSKVISPDFVEPQKSFYPVGSSVWHPDLGTCTVLSVDEKNNSLTLSTSSNAEIDMVLSQVRSKIRASETVAEHVPMKPLVHDEVAPKVPQYTSRSDVFVSIPEVFKGWQRSQQFMYLTRSQNLTTDQANDVFSVLDGNKPMFHSVTIKWQSLKETQDNILPGPAALSTKANEIKSYPGLQDKNLWHPDFGECSVASIEGNQLILQTSVGQIPCVLDATLSKLAVLTSSTPEHAPKQLGPRVLVAAATPIVERHIKVSLPEVFTTWRIVDQYQYLTGNRSLTPDQANDVIDALASRPNNGNNEYEIQWTSELPEASKRAEFKQQLLDKVEKASIVPAAPLPPVAVDSGTKRVVENAVVKKEVTVKKMAVDLPTDFNNWTASGQYVFLTRTKQLTFNEANDILDILGGKPRHGNTEYAITWSGSPVSQVPASQRIVNETVGESVVKTEAILTKISVELPAIYKKWASSGQFGFLTRTRQLTSNEANDVMAILDGKKPQNSKIKYEVTWN